MTQPRATNERPSKARTRREFLRSTAAASAATFVAPAVLRGVGPESKKLRVAVIGCGGRGGGNLQSVASEQIVAICDVNEAAVRAAGQRHPDARRFTDFRKLYERPEDFDAVVVSTCEHTHAFATLPALQLGKHVYCEKPLSYNIHEARVIREAAAKAKVATQMGIQIHAEDNYRRVVELIRTGAIGAVSEVHVWVSRAWGWQGSEAESRKNRDIVHVQDRPTNADPIPKDLDWDLWLGPAPERPFNNVYVPGPKWYRWWDFGNGTMSDLGSHRIDLPFWALDLKYPKTIEAHGPPPHDELAPASMSVDYEYAAEGNQPAVKLTWHQGVAKPALWKEKQIPQWGDGVLFVGADGILLADYFKHVLLPEEKFAKFERPPATIPKSRGQHGEWIHACKTGEPTTCDFEYSGWLTEANHLGNVAFRAGKKLEWDAEKMAATNAPEVDKFVRREYRSGWKLG